jgi:F-box/WD-40 domain protein MET30
MFSSQLSHLSEALSQIIRVDPFTLFPREVCLRVLGYLDAISLGKAAQVSKLWKGLADDDLLWRRMCGQHIERKCTKCGWGLPLLERRRLRKELNLGAPDRMMVALEHDDHEHEQEDKNQQPVSPEALGINGHRMVSLPRSFNAQIMPGSGSSTSGGGEAGTAAEDSARGNSSSMNLPSMKRPATCSSSSRKRRRVESSTRSKSGASEGSSDSDATPAVYDDNAEHTSVEPDERRIKKPWKHVYCERLIVERNWRKGRYTERTLKVSTPRYKNKSQNTDRR